MNYSSAAPKRSIRERPPNGCRAFTPATHWERCATTITSTFWWAIADASRRLTSVGCRMAIMGCVRISSIVPLPTRFAPHNVPKSVIGIPASARCSRATRLRWAGKAMMASSELYREDIFLEKDDIYFCFFLGSPMACITPTQHDRRRTIPTTQIVWPHCRNWAIAVLRAISIIWVCNFFV